jgi:L-asparaginase
MNDDTMNLVTSDEQNPQKSRILLMLAPLKPRATAEIRDLFYSY